MTGRAAAAVVAGPSARWGPLDARASRPPHCVGRVRHTQPAQKNAGERTARQAVPSPGPRGDADGGQSGLFLGVVLAVVVVLFLAGQDLVGDQP